MKKVLKIENLDCANCASKIEHSIRKVEGVDKVSVSFMTQKMILFLSDDYTDADAVLDEIQRLCRKIDDDFNIVVVS